MFNITNKLQFSYVVKKIAKNRQNRYSVDEISNVLVFETWAGKSVAELSKYIENLVLDQILENENDVLQIFKRVHSKYSCTQLKMGVALHP